MEHYLLRARPRLTFAIGTIVLGILAALVQAQDDAAQQPKRTGQFITVASPITDRVDSHVRRAAQEALKAAKQEGRWPILVFEIEPGDTEFGRVLDLAKYIAGRKLDGATTVAFLPKTIKGHAVLLALACDQIVMADKAQIGEAGIHEAQITPDIRAAYKWVSERGAVPPALALGMLDPAASVWLIETPQGRDFVLAEDLEAEKEKGAVATKELVPRGEAALFSGLQARTELEFVKLLAENRQAVAQGYGLPRQALEEDRAFEEGWQTVRVDLKTPFTEEKINQAQMMLENARRDNKNFFCIWLDSAGGTPAQTLSLAGWLANLDPSQYRTVAYISGEARGDAAMIALACDRIVMHPKSILGGEGDANPTPEEIAGLVEGIREIAEKKYRSPALAAAMLDPAQKVFRYERNEEGFQEVRFLTEEEGKELQQENGWSEGRRISAAGELLQVDGTEALEYGLAWETVDSFAGFKRLFGLEKDPALLEPTWVDVLVEVLRSDVVTGMLLMIAFMAFFAEMQMPSFGLGWLISGMCFLLFFWAYALGGTAGWLEVLLFVAGVGCLLLEFFVLPGFGLFGLAGGLMVLSSLILASQTFIVPHNEYQLWQLTKSVLALCFAGVGTLIAAALMRHYLPHTPYLNRIMLEPPKAEESAAAAKQPVTSLVGATGKATTQLVPSGKARIQGEIYDVIAEGEFIKKGEAITVVEARGNRIVVRSLG